MAGSAAGTGIVSGADGIPNSAPNKSLQESPFPDILHAMTAVQASAGANQGEERAGLRYNLELVLQAVRRSFDPSGRARRTEVFSLLFWPQLLLIPVGIVLMNLDAAIIAAAIAGTWQAILVIGLPAAIARRLHDQSKSGWFAAPVVALSLAGLYVLFRNWTAGPFERFELFAEMPTLKAIVSLACLAYLFVCMLPGQNGTNRFGPDPREG